jgi:hypothetical protein
MNKGVCYYLLTLIHNISFGEAKNILLFQNIKHLPVTNPYHGKQSNQLSFIGFERCDVDFLERFPPRKLTQFNLRKVSKINPLDFKEREPLLKEGCAIRNTYAIL